MIPRNFIIEWRQHAPWISDAQVEQDLIICRALVELFSSELIAKTLAFRGGTALYKLYCNPSPRYSEDIDLVQVDQTPIGEVVSEIRNILNPWLGPPKWKQGQGRFTLTYTFQSEGNPPIPMKLKIEINTREHFSVNGFIHKNFKVDSGWFQGNAPILTYHLEELMGTKLRALFQRKKGRDLFDFWFVIKHHQIDLQNVVKTFHHYLDKQSIQVSRAQFEQNLIEKATSIPFIDDIRALLSPEIESQWNFEEALSMMKDKLCPCLTGETWKGAGNSPQPLIDSQNNIAPLPSLGETLIKKRGDELAQSVREILAAGANVNDTSLNGHRPLQLLIRANLEPRKKLELVKSIIELGADIHSADRSGLTPYQVAIAEGNKDISDFLRYEKKVRPMSPPGTGYAQHYNMYREIPLP